MFTFHRANHRIGQGCKRKFITGIAEANRNFLGFEEDASEGLCTSCDLLIIKQGSPAPQLENVKG